MARRVQIRELRDPDRFRWPPGRSDAVAYGGSAATVVLFAVGEWALGAGTVVVAALGFFWPTAEKAVAKAGDQEIGLVRRPYEADYEIVDDPDDEPDVVDVDVDVDAANDVKPLKRPAKLLRRLRDRVRRRR